MTAQTLPMPLSSVAAAPAPPRIGPSSSTQSPLARRVRVAFGAIVASTAAATLLTAWQSHGGARFTVLVLGGAACALALTMAHWLLRRIVHPLAPLSEAARRLSVGELASAVDRSGGGELRPVLESLHGVRERLHAVVGQVRAATKNVAINATQIAGDNQALATRTLTQGESLQQTVTAVQQLTATLRAGAATAQQAHALARAAAGRAEQGGAAMSDVVQTMDAIRESSHGIRDIIGVIDGIAFRTNLLALNAAVEAARAGAQGRGFAVVAAEVRTLAQRCAEAAREIRSLIVASVDQVDAGAGRVTEASEAIAGIVQEVREVAQLVGRMDAVSQEQSRAIGGIDGAVARIDGATQENAMLVQSAARTAAALKERAAGLTAAMSMFQLGEREQGTLEEAQALVQRGCEFLRARGRDALVADVNRLEKGRFIERDLYLLVLDPDGVFIAHGNNPGRVGTGPQLKDLDGKRFAVEFARVARAEGQGCVYYKWQHAVTGEILTRGAFVHWEDGVVIASPFYRS